MVATPLGFVLSLVGVFRDGKKLPAVVGLALTGLLIGAFFFVALCR